MDKGPETSLESLEPNYKCMPFSMHHQNNCKNKLYINNTVINKKILHFSMFWVCLFIFHKCCKLNFGPMQGQVKPHLFLEMIGAKRYFHFSYKFLGIISWPSG